MMYYAGMPIRSPFRFVDDKEAASNEKPASDAAPKKKTSKRAK